MCLAIAALFVAAGNAVALRLLHYSSQRARAQEQGVNQWAREHGLEIPYPQAEEDPDGS